MFPKAHYSSPFPTKGGGLATSPTLRQKQRSEPQQYYENATDLLTSNEARTRFKKRRQEQRGESEDVTKPEHD